MMIEGDTRGTGPEQEPYQREIFIIFDGPPGPEGGRFVEIETADGRSVHTSDWTRRDDGTWALGPFVRVEDTHD